jgi:hypothetical protein
MFKEGLIKGILVFFLGLFVGTYGTKVFRPSKAPTEGELLARMIQMQREKASLIQDMKEVLDGPVQMAKSADNKDKGIMFTIIAIDKLTEVIDLHLDIRSPYDQANRKKPEKLEGYEKYDSEGRIVKDDPSEYEESEESAQQPEPPSPPAQMPKDVPSTKKK